LGIKKGNGNYARRQILQNVYGFSARFNVNVLPYFDASYILITKDYTTEMEEKETTGNGIGIPIRAH